VVKELIAQILYKDSCAMLDWVGVLQHNQPIVLTYVPTNASP